MPSSYYHHEEEFITDNIEFEQVASFQYLQSAVTSDNNCQSGVRAQVCWLCL